MSNVVHIVADDWEGLYANGDLIYEGHVVPKKVFTEALQTYGVECTFFFFNNDGVDWIEDEGNLPKRLDDIPSSYYEAYRTV